MGDQRKGGIAWTQETWNPIRGCRQVSPGCRNCYAMKQAGRMSGPGGAYEGLVKVGKWTGAVRFVGGKTLEQPLRWTRPRLIFVPSMSDPFHVGFSNEQIAALFGVMAACPQHTFQVLTKRIGRALEWFRWLTEFALDQRPIAAAPSHRHACINAAFTALGETADAKRRLDREWEGDGDLGPWPLPNVHLLASVEDQKRADERIPLLLQCPAAVRGISLEPMLGPVDLTNYLGTIPGWEPPSSTDSPTVLGDALRSLSSVPETPGIDWVIVGGESGQNARPCDVEWIRDVVRQCQRAGVPVFVKQMGARPCVNGAGDGPGYSFERRRKFWGITDTDGACHEIYSPKGGDPAEWPEDLRVREWPER